jgi:hypothetical protein
MNRTRTTPAPADAHPLPIAVQRSPHGLYHAGCGGPVSIVISWLCRTKPPFSAGCARCRTFWTRYHFNEPWTKEEP